MLREECGFPYQRWELLNLALIHEPQQISRRILGARNNRRMPAGLFALLHCSNGEIQSHTVQDGATILPSVIDPSRRVSESTTKAMPLAFLSMQAIASRSVASDEIT